MALDARQWDIVTRAMKDLREIGCAVCVFTPDDVESAGEGREDDETENEAPTGEMPPIDGAAWLMDNRRMLEDGMSTWGNQAISDNLLP